MNNYNPYIFTIHLKNISIIIRSLDFLEKAKRKSKRSSEEDTLRVKLNDPMPSSQKIILEKRLEKGADKVAKQCKFQS